MTELIIFCLFASFVICGLNFASEEGSVLHFLRRPFEKASDRLLNGSNYDLINGIECKHYNMDYLIEWIGKPLIMCAKCMASIWGTLLYWFWFEEFVITEWLCVILCISFFNAFWSCLYHKI